MSGELSEKRLAELQALAEKFFADDKKPTVSIFMCGPSKCEHDWGGTQEWTDENGVFTSTAVCLKCGATAIDEAMWND